MGYHPRIETSEISSHITSRTKNSALWFVNNKNLESNILGIIAKGVTKRKVKLFALGIEGSHIHQAAKFPKANRADYTRDINSSIAKAVQRHAPDLLGGLWHRRYSAEYMSHPEDIEKYFFYIALQPVNDGLVSKISEFPGYNFFNDAISGTTRKFKVLNRSRMYEAKRNGKKIHIKDYEEIYELQYERLPGYEDLSQLEYRRIMLQKLEFYRQEIIKRRVQEGKRLPLGTEKILRIKPGAIPRSTKVTGQFEHRPRVLTACSERSKVMQAWYFAIYFEYKEASLRYRGGDEETKFPPGTYKPPKFTCACLDALHRML